MNPYIKIISICLTGLLSSISIHDLYYWRQKKSTYQKTIAERAKKIAINPSFLMFKSLNQEVVLPELNIQGIIPSWLNGTLVRNGAGKFETFSEVTSHPFDGFAM